MNDHKLKTPFMDKLLVAACIFTRADVGLALQSNDFDRLTLIFHAVALFVVTLIAILAWTAFFGVYLSSVTALICGGVVAMAIYLLDQAMGASDWELAGVLRPNGSRPSGHWWLKLLLRVAVAVLLSLATAWAATMWMFSDAIDNEIQAERTRNNAPLEAEYAAKTAALGDRLVAPLEAEIDDIRRERNVLTTKLERVRDDRFEKQQRVTSAINEMEREQFGDGKGYVEGRGPRWREARRQRSQSEVELAMIEEDLHKYESRHAQLTERLDAQVDTLAVSRAEYDRKAQALSEEKGQDSRWIQDRNDPLMQALALQRLENDPVYGAVTLSFKWLMQTVLIVLEMMFLLTKTVFSPASVYTARLIARTKVEAVEVDAEMARKIAEIREARPRPELRIVASPDGEEESVHEEVQPKQVNEEA